MHRIMSVVSRIVLSMLSFENKEHQHIAYDCQDLKLKFSVVVNREALCFDV